MKFSEVKIIEDRFELFAKKKLKLTKTHLFVGPTDIQDIEYWEDRLDKLEVPYVTAQFEIVSCINETAVEAATEKGEKLNPELRYNKGYGIFIRKEDLKLIEEPTPSVVDTDSESADDEQAA